MQNTLSELHEWRLDHKKDDIRGWSLLDADGQVLGMVDELIVDTDSKHVTQVVLGDGRTFSAREVLIGDHDLRLAGVSHQRLAARAKAATLPPARPAAAAKKDLPLAQPDLVVPVIEEEIRIGKREVDAGGVHLQSKIVSEPFDEDVRLREEHVSVERRLVDQPLTLADADARLREDVVELRASSERVVIERRVRVVEEVRLKKDSSVHVEHIRDSIRHTEVDVQEISGNGAPGTKKGVRP